MHVLAGHHLPVRLTRTAEEAWSVLDAARCAGRPVCVWPLDRLCVNLGGKVGEVGFGPACEQTGFSLQQLHPVGLGRQTPGRACVKTVERLCSRRHRHLRGALSRSLCVGCGGGVRCWRLLFSNLGDWLAEERAAV